QQGFGPEASLSWARFDLEPAAITRNNYAQLAAQYNAAVPAPPAEFKWLDTSAQHQWKSFDEAERSQFFTLEVTIDDEYEFDQAEVDKNYTHYTGEKIHFGH